MMDDNRKKKRNTSTRAAGVQTPRSVLLSIVLAITFNVYYANGAFVQVNDLCMKILNNKIRLLQPYASMSESVHLRGR